MEKIIEREYDIQKFAITKENISLFEIIENRRIISEGHVGKIHGVLIRGENPVGILIVNKKHNKFRLIDGNHRLEAIKKYFANHPSQDIKVECVLKIYDDLNDEEERKIYKDEATRRNETAEDRLQMYKSVITFWKLISDPLTSFPTKISIYGSQNTMKFRNLLYALNTVKRQSDAGYYPKYVSKDDIVDFALSLNIDDYNLCKEFFEFFNVNFGIVGKDNIFSLPHFFIPLFDIYVRNRSLLGVTNFDERFKKVINRADIMTYLKLSNREAQIRIRKAMIEYMNFGISKNLFY